MSMSQMDRLQKALVNNMSSGKGLTKKEASRLGITRLAGSIYDLRACGFTIKAEKRKIRGEKVTIYYLL